MTLLDALITPFAEYAFMRRALAAGIILSLGGAPLGVFMMLRRMTLVGDALAHALLPGIAVAFLVAGLSFWALTLGGLIAAVIVALMAAFLVRATRMKEDAAFTLLYLLSLAVGVSLLSMKGSSLDLVHLLFGNVLAVDAPTLGLVTGVSVVSLFALAVLYRRLVIDGFDPDFLRTAGVGRRFTGMTGLFFFIMLMINLVAAFQAMGTLMALGLIVLPGVGARFWARTLDGLLPLAVGIAVFAVYAGLVLSFHGHIPSGPAITLVAGGIALVSAFIGRYGSVKARALG